MIGAIVGLFDLVKTAGAATDKAISDPNKRDMIKSGMQFLGNNKDAINKLTGKARSIATMANKRIQEYPLVISNAFGDNLDVAFEVVKFSEACFAYFLLVSIGIDPVVQDKRPLSAHIAQFGTEGFDVEIETVKNIPEDLRYAYEALMESSSKMYETHLFDNSKEDYADVVKGKAIKKYYEYEPDNTASTGYYYNPATKKYQYAHQIINKNGKDYWADADGNVIEIKINGVMTPQEVTASGTPENGNLFTRGNRIEKTADGIGTLVENKAFTAPVFPEHLSKRMGKSLPTTITVHLIVGDNRIPVTLGVKAIPHFITSDEMSALFKRCLETGSILRKFLRLTSGEFNFFKDFLFNLKQIKEDQKMYAKLERHPWYRMLLNRKIKSTVNTIGGLYDKMSGLMKDQAILPTVTLVTTVEELSEAISYPYYDAVKVGKIEKIINHYMLLGLFVYDFNRNTLNCHFGGIKEPYIIREKDLKNKDKTDLDDFVKTMQTLMIKNY